MFGPDMSRRLLIRKNGSDDWGDKKTDALIRYDILNRVDPYPVQISNFVISNINAADYVNTQNC